MTAYARISDPAQSHITGKSLDNDTSLKGLILTAVSTLIMLTQERYVTDDEVWHYLEEVHAPRRFQRNVIARTRGLMEREGLLEHGPDRILKGQHRVAYTIPSFQPKQRQLFP